MAVYNYPAACSLDYKKPTSVKECLPQARLLVKREEKEGGPRRIGPVKKGERILIMSVPDQDEYVREAMTQALVEAGAQQVEFVYPQELVGREPEVTSVADGWREVKLLEEGRASGSATETDLLTGLALGDGLRKYLDMHPEFTSVYGDVAGANMRRALGKHAPKFNGFWSFNTWDEFFSKGWVFPDNLWKEIERRVVEVVGKASAVRITDPEGTYLEYSLTAEEARRWQVHAPLQSHLFMEPLMATASEVMGRPDVPPIFPAINGVLAGTANHCGFFPRIEVYFENERLVEVKGGGTYGDGIREMMDKYENVHWPYYPGKGFFWFCDCALCTAVKAFRRTSDMFHSYWLYPNLPERTRAGVLHMGFGCRRHGKEFDRYIQKHNLPTGHIHVHNYFPTFELKLQGTEYWHKIVDKGYITCLEDPEVKAIASKYGHPDKLLTYDWIPPLPGINCEGNYLQDYAPDPVKYLRQRLKENEPI